MSVQNHPVVRPEPVPGPAQRLFVIIGGVRGRDEDAPGRLPDLCRT